MLNASAGVSDFLNASVPPTATSDGTFEESLTPALAFSIVFLFGLIIVAGLLLILS